MHRGRQDPAAGQELGDLGLRRQRVSGCSLGRRVDLFRRSLSSSDLRVQSPAIRRGDEPLQPIGLVETPERRARLLGLLPVAQGFLPASRSPFRPQSLRDLLRGDLRSEAAAQSLPCDGSVTKHQAAIELRLVTQPIRDCLERYVDRHVRVRYQQHGAAGPEVGLDDTRESPGLARSGRSPDESRVAPQGPSDNPKLILVHPGRTTLDLGARTLICDPRTYRAERSFCAGAVESDGPELHVVQPAPEFLDKPGEIDDQRRVADHGAEVFLQVDDELAVDVRDHDAPQRGLAAKLHFEGGVVRDRHLRGREPIPPMALRLIDTRARAHRNDRLRSPVRV